MRGNSCVFCPEVIEGLIGHQLCGWELLTVAADCAAPRNRELLRSQGLSKKRQVQELYDVLRRQAHSGPSHWNASLADCEASHAVAAADLPQLLAQLEMHEAETLDDYARALMSAPYSAASVLARQREETRDALAALARLRKELTAGGSRFMFVAGGGRGEPMSYSFEPASRG